ncbi:MAG: hypothetical protein HYZ15_05910 [Sphingobacteriales bacterium]|nr:hypothetical protein [Sphingobacteriales bacterium]
MPYLIYLSIIVVCLGVIFWSLGIYKENRKLEKRQQKYKDDDDFRAFR